jgi:hypothetical protein
MAALGATVGAGLVFLLLFYILRTVDFGPYAEKFQNLIIPEAIRKQLDPEAYASPTSQQNQAVQQAIDTYLLQSGTKQK